MLFQKRDVCTKFDIYLFIRYQFLKAQLVKRDTGYQKQLYLGYWQLAKHYTVSVIWLLT